MEWVCVTLKGLKVPPHVGRSYIAVPSIYKEVHGLPKEETFNVKGEWVKNLNFRLSIQTKCQLPCISNCFQHYGICEVLWELSIFCFCTYKQWQKWKFPISCRSEFLTWNFLNPRMLWLHKYFRIIIIFRDRNILQNLVMYNLHR